MNQEDDMREDVSRRKAQLGRAARAPGEKTLQYCRYCDCI
jgi:hypothetical protein